MTTQLTDFQRKIIVLFKEENPAWGLKQCSAVLPNVFSKITKRGAVFQVLKESSLKCYKQECYKLSNVISKFALVWLGMIFQLMK